MKYLNHLEPDTNGEYVKLANQFFKDGTIAIDFQIFKNSSTTSKLAMKLKKEFINHLPENTAWCGNREFCELLDVFPADFSILQTEFSKWLENTGKHLHFIDNLRIGKVGDAISMSDYNGITEKDGRVDQTFNVNGTVYMFGYDYEIREQCYS